jgi:serine O-acetyltransferase
MRKYSKLIQLLLGFQFMRAILLLILFNTSPAKGIIKADIERWYGCCKELDGAEQRINRRLVVLLWRFPEFRNLFYHRIKIAGGLATRLAIEAAMLFFAPMNTLFIVTQDIGEGLFIQHGFSTIISAARIGKNCWINQQVTIGYSDFNATPTIGDGVMIAAGAKVFGKISIGNNSIVGANAVVSKNVPPNCTVVGIPAYIIKRDGKKVREEL